MPLRPRPLRLPSITHIHPAPRQQEVTRDPVVLIGLRDDPAAVLCVREVDPGGRCGWRRWEGVAVDAESALQGKARVSGIGRGEGGVGSVRFRRRGFGGA